MDYEVDSCNFDDGEGGEVCWSCHGEGYYHDCGEDTCCCPNPEDDDLYMCHECRGRGYV